MKFFSIRMGIQSLPSIRKVYRLVSAVSPVYQRVTQGSPKKILQSTKLFRVYCGSIPISRRDLRSILNSLPKSTKCILNLRDIPNSLRSLQSIPNDPSEYTKSIRKVLGIFDSYTKLIWLTAVSFWVTLGWLFGILGRLRILIRILENFISGLCTCAR